MNVVDWLIINLVIKYSLDVIKGKVFVLFWLENDVIIWYLMVWDKIIIIIKEIKVWIYLI